MFLFEIYKKKNDWIGPDYLINLVNPFIRVISNQSDDIRGFHLDYLRSVQF